MRILRLGAGTFALAASLAAPVGAAPANGPTPAALQRLLDCRAVTDRDARLACFDAQAAAVGSAVASKDLVVADRAQIKQARRSLFGLTLPNLDIFSGGEADAAEEEEFTRLETTIARVGRRPDQRWTFILEDGAKWYQVDSRQLIRDPKPGMKIAIRKAAMGSFLANVGGQIAIRVRREN